MEYYIFPTEAAAQACLDFVNGTTWFPIVGTRNGEPHPESQNTTNWIDCVSEMLDGRWAFPRIPESRLDAIGVPAEDRAAFFTTFNPTVETLTSEAFPAPPEEEM